MKIFADHIPKFHGSKDEDVKVWLERLIMLQTALKIDNAVVAEQGVQRRGVLNESGYSVDFIEHQHHQYNIFQSVPRYPF